MLPQFLFRIFEVGHGLNFAEGLGIGFEDFFAEIEMTPGLWGINSILEKFEVSQESVEGWAFYCLGLLDSFSQIPIGLLREVLRNEHCTEVE